MIEAQIPYILGCLELMADRRVASIEVREQPLDAFNDQVQHKLKRTVWNSGGCSSWYLDSQGRNVTLWPDFTWRYRLALRRFDAENYRLLRSRQVEGLAPPNRVRIS
jgi:cyclohexanone monooxygenase